MKTPIRNWHQVLAGFMFVFGPLLLLVAAFDRDGKAAAMGIFQLVMAWRLWTVATKAEPAENPASGHG